MNLQTYTSLLLGLESCSEIQTFLGQAVQAASRSPPVCQWCRSFDRSNLKHREVPPHAVRIMLAVLQTLCSLGRRWLPVMAEGGRD